MAELFSCSSALEVAVNGKKQGVTKKKVNTKSGRLLISKLGLFRKYLEVVESNPDLEVNNDTNLIQSCTYLETKQNCEEYNDLWKDLKQKYFGSWTTKPEELLKFR